jgi:hypothetical protein
MSYRAPEQHVEVGASFRVSFLADIAAEKVLIHAFRSG